MLSRQFNIFFKVAELQSVSKASEELFLSKSAISISISKLEEYLKLNLFNRDYKEMALTPAGFLLFEHLKKIKKLCNETELELKRFRDRNTKLLRIGASSTFGEFILPKIMGLYNNKYPDVLFEPYISNKNTILGYLLNGIIDVGFLVCNNPPEETVNTKILEDLLVLIASPAHPLCNKKQVEIKDLIGQSFILREKESRTRITLEDILSKMNFNPALLKVTEFHTLGAIKSAVEANLGISIISHYAITKEVSLGTLKILKVKDLIIKRNVYLSYRKYEQPSLEVQKLITVFNKNILQDFI